jgi:acetylglutamate kinase
VAQLQANKTNAMGFSGADGNLIQSNKEIIQPLITDMGDVQKSVQFIITNTWYGYLFFVRLHTINKDNY